MPVSFWMATIAGCSAVVGFTLNLLVILVRFLKQKTTSAFQLVLVMVAFNDMMLSILFAFVAALMYRDFHWIYPRFACKLLFPMVTTLMTVNVGCIFLVSYERYRAVVHPFTQRLSLKKTFIISAVIWLLSIIMTIPNIVALQIQSYSECRETWGDSLTPKVYSACMLLFVYIMPLSCIIAMHLRIGLKLKKASKDMRQLNYSSTRLPRNKVKRNIKIMWLLVSIVLAFSVFVLPTKIYYFVWDFTPQLVTEKVSVILNGYKSLYYLHVIVNPILYSVSDSDFRKDITDVFCCKLSKSSKQSSAVLT